jgi:hypothetical protein
MIPDQANACAGVFEEGNMNRLHTACLVALVLSGSLAHAAPPTVVPSPGYDARLQEQHRVLSSTPTSTAVQATQPVTPPPRHHAKRTH